MARKQKAKDAPKTESYQHPTAESLLRPEVGTQAQFRKKKPPATYRYDSSLDPAMSWDEGHAAREEGESLIGHILEAKTLEDAKAAGSKLKAMSAPFLNWTGKAERREFQVPTLPLFIHERLSTRAIIETLKGHKKGAEQMALFADPQHSITDQVLRAYEHRDKWVNRMILGDSLVVMNSLLHYEGMGGQVQMIYMDPPYGVKFGSNFQPFVRKRDVKHNDDDDMTYEPEMVQAYRDTWELGLHSYLTYLRDRLLLCLELLSPTGSIFVQISDENIHHLKELLDEVFGCDNFQTLITFKKTGGQTDSKINKVCDHILHYSRDKARAKFSALHTFKIPGGEGGEKYVLLESPDGKTYRPMSKEEIANPALIPEGWRPFRKGPLNSQHFSPTRTVPFEYKGKTYHPGKNRQWTVDPQKDLPRLAEMGYLIEEGTTLAYKLYLKDNPLLEVNNLWTDTAFGTMPRDQLYVVQTAIKVIQRCILMTTDPGDLVLDPTCGSGTTAYVAEQWGRRWITTDVSRVPLALARQRLLTATFDYYELRDEAMGPAGGFVYKRKQNKKGEEVGGIVPHITLKSIANNEPPQEEVLVDRPEKVNSITRVSGPFVVEATIPTPMDWSQDETKPLELREEQGTYEDRMQEVLRKVKTIHLPGNRKVVFKNVRAPAKTLSLSAEALVNGEESGGVEPKGKPVAFVFGPENGSASETLVFEAAREAYGKGYAHLFVIGFGIEPNARILVEKCSEVVGIPATYVEAARDLMMGDLLKNLRSSQVFSVCGLPDVEIVKAKEGKFQVKLLGVDVFDPITMRSDSRSGDDAPAWFLDTDYNGRVFHVCQAFFPRTGAWENLKKALRADYTTEVWDHLAGTVSAPFEAGVSGRIAVKVIDDRGNELLVVKEIPLDPPLPKGEKKGGNAKK
ncbi:MAG: site-specific DNA-methyltransferase [Thermodesulfobacteriota bacterium]